MAAGQARTGCPAVVAAGEGAHPGADPVVQVPDAPVAADLIAVVLIAEVPAAVVLVCRALAACQPVAARVPDDRVVVPGSAAVGL